MSFLTAGDGISIFVSHSASINGEHVALFAMELKKTEKHLLLHDQTLFAQL